MITIAATASSDRARRLGRTLATALLSAVVVLAVWQGLIWAFGLDPLVAKTPGDVWRHLFVEEDAAVNRTVLVDAMRTTAWEAGVGFVVGTAAALVLSVAFVLWRPVSHAVMPVALVLQAVPLSAVTPMLLVMFGRGLLGTAVICGIITFFPALVNLVIGLRSVPPEIEDVLAALGGGRLTLLRKAQLPSAVPAFFASARIAVPRALIGALLAEWIATGRGIGYLMLQSKITYEYERLWAAVALSTFVMVLAYGVISTVEGVAVSRFAPHQREAL